MNGKTPIELLGSNENHFLIYGFFNEMELFTAYFAVAKAWHK